MNNKLSITALLLIIFGYASKAQTLDKDTIQVNEISIFEHQVRKTEGVLKLNVPLKYIPTATSTIDSKSLESFAIQSVNDAFDYTTGITPKMNYGGFQTFRMRGFGSPIVMVDGQLDYRMAYSNSAPISSTANIERIEYLKGPASALYGGSSVGGIVNIVRKNPWSSAENRASYSISSYNNHDARVSTCHRIGDNLSYRVDANWIQSDGWRDNGKTVKNLYFALGWKLSSKDQIEFRFGAFNDRYDTEAGTPSFTHDIYATNGDKKTYNKGDLPKNMDRKQRYNDPADFLKSKNLNGYVKWEHHFNPKNYLAISTSYSQDDIDYFSTEELTYITSKSDIKDHYYMKGDQKVYIDINHLQRSYPLRFQHLTNTLQSNIEYNSTFRLLGAMHHTSSGISYFQTKRDGYTGYNADDIWGAGKGATISVENPELYQGEIDSKFSAVRRYNDRILAFNIQDLIDITPHFKMMLGARVDHFFFNKSKASVDANKDTGDFTKEGSFTDQAFSYKTGMVYEIAKTISLYGSISNFYKPYRTIYNENYIYKDTNGNIIAPNKGGKIFDPEEGLQYELGAKVEKSKVSIQANLYHITKKNIKTYLGKEDGKKVYGQIGEVTSKGAEVDITSYLTKEIELNGGYCYNKTQDSNNKQGSFAPNNSAYGRISWHKNRGLLKGLSAWWGIVYTDTQFSDSANTYLLPSSLVQNIGLKYEHNHMWIQANIRNISNEMYYNSSIYSNQYVAAPERNWGITLGLRF
ncbi:TonB-dependent receptor [Halosquirtibacter laminarini]|uniref:TonB-dependent receptor n=1 Tax=Halosquirtibacter laminarini TaxID=3374600 RepID=A0AC61NGX6_9BACT|nr:TonB-dependent receptor [Prolixibacteraceae bacterium]